MNKYSLKAHFRGEAPLWFVFGVTLFLGMMLLQVISLILIVRFGGSGVVLGLPIIGLTYFVLAAYALMSLIFVWKCRRNSQSGLLLWFAEFLPKYYVVGGLLTGAAFGMAYILDIWF